MEVMWAALVNLKQELAGLLVKEEKLWQQRFKTHWMKSGEKTLDISTLELLKDIGGIGFWG